MEGVAARAHFVHRVLGRSVLFCPLCGLELSVGRARLVHLGGALRADFHDGGDGRGQVRLSRGCLHLGNCCGECQLVILLLGLFCYLNVWVTCSLRSLVRVINARTHLLQSDFIRHGS